MVDAVVRNFEIIGEASKSIPLTVRRSYPNIPWAQMNGMRNVLVHEYFGVDIKIIWHAIKKNLPSLRKQLQLLLKEAQRSK